MQHCSATVLDIWFYSIITGLFLLFFLIWYFVELFLFDNLSRNRVIFVVNEYVNTTYSYIDVAPLGHNILIPSQLVSFLIDLTNVLDNSTSKVHR